jgi:hypothetical protein
VKWRCRSHPAGWDREAVRSLEESWPATAGVNRVPEDLCDGFDLSRAGADTYIAAYPLGTKLAPGLTSRNEQGPRPCKASAGHLD